MKDPKAPIMVIAQVYSGVTKMDNFPKDHGANMFLFGMGLNPLRI